MKTLFKIFVVVFGLVTVLANNASAADPLLLAISGNIGEKAGNGVIQLSRTDIEAMPKTSFTTSTIWTEGKRDFTGVALIDLMDAVGASGTRLLATALNDYKIEVPFSDVVKGGPIIAYQMDGKPMSVRDKGPLWLVYPYDANADYRTETIYSRSIWQLDRIEVVK